MGLRPPGFLITRNPMATTKASRLAAEVHAPSAESAKRANKVVQRVHGQRAARGAFRGVPGPHVVLGGTSRGEHGGRAGSEGADAAVLCSGAQPPRLLRVAGRCAGGVAGCWVIDVDFEAMPQIR